MAERPCPFMCELYQGGAAAAEETAVEMSNYYLIDKETGEAYSVDTYFPSRETKVVAKTAPTAFGLEAAPRPKPVYTVVPPRETM